MCLLGYSGTQKGYYCYKSLLRRASYGCYILYVTFFEVVLFNSSSASNQPLPSSPLPLSVLDVSCSSLDPSPGPRHVPSPQPPLFLPSSHFTADPLLVYSRRKRRQPLNQPSPPPSQGSDSGIHPSSSSVYSILPISLPTDLCATMRNPRWRAAMVDEITALKRNNT